MHIYLLCVYSLPWFRTNTFIFLKKIVSCAWLHKPKISSIWKAEAGGSKVQSLPEQLNEIMSQSKTRAGDKSICSACRAPTFSPQ